MKKIKLTRQKEEGEMTVLDQGSTNGSQFYVLRINRLLPLNPIGGTLVVDKEIDMMNARREIRVRIPG